MRALTIHQPYASLIAAGVKPAENRTRRTSYRGPLAIHAGLSRAWLRPGDDEAALLFGAFVAVAELWNCVPIDLVPPALRGHEHVTGPFCWLLRRVVRLSEPIPARGYQSLWRPAAGHLGPLTAALRTARR